MYRPSDEELAIGGLGLVGLLVLGWQSGALQEAATVTLDVFERGAKLTDAPPDSSGVVPDQPVDLWGTAADNLGQAVDSQTYSLARMGRSEGVNGMEYRMHVALNDLADLQRTYGTGVYSDLDALMLHSKVAAADGHYSEQELGKRYSTAHDPYAGDYELAAKVRADRAAGIDLAQGAIKFVDKSSFGVQAGTGSYDDLAAQWTSQGLVPFNVDGATDDLVLWRRA